MTPIPWTATDIDVGVHLARTLAAHGAAANGAPIAVADLLALARKAHPRDTQLARAVPLGVAPKLQFVAAFCLHSGYPDLTRLLAEAVIPAVAGPADPVAPDWHAVLAQIDGPLAAFAQAARASVPARFKPRAERPADVAWYAYFRSHRAECLHLSAEGKQEIINLLMAGLDPETALARVLIAQQKTQS